MAKEGKKLELFEILAANRAKGKAPLGLDAKNVKQANTPDPEPEVVDRPGLIIDDAIGAELRAPPAPEVKASPVSEPPRHQPPVGDRPETQRVHREAKPAKHRATPPPQNHSEPEPAPEPRPRSPREVVLSLDTAFFFFVIVLALVVTSFLIGYQRGQEERPTGLAGLGEIEIGDRDSLNIRHLAPPPRASIRPQEQDFTLIIRKEPATEDLPERLELELAEALARGRKEAGYDFPGFIFLTGGNDPSYILAVGLADKSNDPLLTRLNTVYYDMDGINLSRQPKPYRSCRVAPVRELGVLVY